MLQLTNDLWVGDSDDGYLKDTPEIEAVLNVAYDLKGKCSWPIVEYAQVGLVDGPGNEVADYCAAVLALVSLLRRYDAVMVYDHNGGRALAVAMMYLRLVEGKVQVRVDYLRRRTWQEQLDMRLLVMENEPLPKVHPAHVEAFERLPYGLLEVI